MNELSYDMEYPTVVLPAESSQTWLARLHWSHWLLLAYPVFVHLISRTRSADEALVVDESAKYQIAVTALYGVYAASIVLRSTPSWLKTLFCRPLLWWTLFLIVAVASSLWSVQPLLTLFRSGQALIFFILIVYAMRCSPSHEEWVKFQFLFGAVLVACSTYTFIVRVYPTEGLSIESLHGWGFPHCLAGLFFLGLGFQDRSWRLLSYTFLIALIISTAAKAYIAFVIGLWFFILFSDFSGRNTFLWAVSFVLLILLLFFPMEALQLFFPGKEMHTIVTGHGRLTVWETMAEEFVVHRPLQGYGFGIGDKLSYVAEGLNFTISHTHNIVLAALMNLGIIGAALTVLFCLDVALAAWRYPDGRWRACNIAALMAIIFTTLFTTSISSNVTSTWLSHAMLMLGVAFHELPASQTVPDDGRHQWLPPRGRRNTLEAII